jgi:predicted O-linked N-acetylglucosamine transferase (SPINDLY family)
LTTSGIVRQASLLFDIGRGDLAQKLLLGVCRRELTDDLRTLLVLYEHKKNGVAGLRAELKKQFLEDALDAKTVHVAVKILASAGLAFVQDDEGWDCIHWLRYGLTKSPGEKGILISLAFLLSQNGTLENLAEARALVDSILHRDEAPDEFNYEELRVLSRAFRNFGDSARSVEAAQWSLDKRAVSTPGRAFLKNLESLKSLPTVLRSEEERVAALQNFEKSLDVLCIADLPSKSEREAVLESLLEISNFHLPYLTEDDLTISQKYSSVHARLSGFFAFENKAETAASQKKIAVIGNFRQHARVFIFGFLSQLVEDRGWDVDLVNIGDARDLRVPEQYTGKVSIVNLPLNVKNYDFMLAHVRHQRYSAVFFPEVGMSPESRFLAFHRLAPIQFTSWLHPVSTASKEMDFFVTGEAMEPPRGQDHYSEKLVSLSGIGQDFFAYTMRPENPSPPQRGRLVCIQSPFKIQPFFDTWLQKILDIKEVVEIYFLRPNAPYQRDVLVERLLALRGNAKMKFFDRLAPDKFVEFLTSCDLALDLPNWSGGNTSIDCFRANLPVICFEGQKMRSRHTFAMYSVMGFSGLLTARTQDAYVELVRRVVSDRAFNSLCRQSIRGGIPKLADSGSRAPVELYDWLSGAVG